jgi:hypothetical protein
MPVFQIIRVEVGEKRVSEQIDDINSAERMIGISMDMSETCTYNYCIQTLLPVGPTQIESSTT